MPEPAPQTRDIVGKAVGVSGKTYDKIKKVMEAAGIMVDQQTPAAGVCLVFQPEARKNANGGDRRSESVRQSDGLETDFVRF